MTGVRIRPATPADVTAIANIWSEGWADGHEGHVPDALAAERAPASQTATGTVPVPAHRYEREVGDG